MELTSREDVERIRRELLEPHREGEVEVLVRCRNCGVDKRAYIPMPKELIGTKVKISRVEP